MNDNFIPRVDKDRALLRTRKMSSLRTALARVFPDLVPGDSIPVNQLMHLVKPGSDPKKIAVSCQNFFFTWSSRNGVTFRGRVGRDEQTQFRLYIVAAKEEVQLGLPV